MSVARTRSGSSIPRTRLAYVAWSGVSIFTSINQKDGEIETNADELDRFALDSTTDQIQIRDTMRRFGQERLAPGAARRDKSHEYPCALNAEVAGLGGMAMKASADGGDALADTTAYVLAVEAISWTSPTLCFSKVGASADEEGLSTTATASVPP